MTLAKNCVVAFVYMHCCSIVPSAFLVLEKMFSEGEGKNKNQTVGLLEGDACLS
jgi:hypothetical protein